MSAAVRVLRHSRSVILCFFAALAGAGLPVQAAESDPADLGTLVLVAKSGMRDPLYRATVLMARPAGAGQHIGFILNKRTNLSLSSAFPNHEPSKKVSEPLYLGGPAGVSAVFALVQSSTSPGKDARQIADDLFVATSRGTVDHIIETDPEHARFFMGGVIWRPGELAEELKRGLWHVVSPSAGKLMPKTTEGMWEEMVREAELSDRAI